MPVERSWTPLFADQTTGSCDTTYQPGYPPLTDWHNEQCNCDQCIEERIEMASCRHCILL